MLKIPWKLNFEAFRKLSYMLITTARKYPFTVNALEDWQKYEPLLKWITYFETDIVS